MTERIEYEFVIYMKQQSMKFPSFCLEQKSIQFIHDAASKSPRLSLDEFNFLLHMCSSSLDAFLSLNVAAHMDGNGYQGTGCENAYIDYECQAFCGRTQLFPGCCQRQ
jgi:hypothetical protein